ncbi:hypothetical protein D9613_001636 [Agrocybe pediades]|uniref:HNH nuclease domain-containing protein n=1 Tax=Agrocybe pediades TaxID=84607 RepID=A0A8H4R5U9_9AGAR|nr:hypothetical protein D9613_001636 [Agrocybe pediades]
MSDLPPPSSKIQADPDYVSAYQRCLTIEHRLLGQLNNNDAAAEDETSLIYIRVMGHLFHFAPPKGLDSLTFQVSSCSSDEDVLQLVKRNKGRTPNPTTHPSRPPFESLSRMISEYLHEAPVSHATAKKKALARDGFRCVVSKVFDFQSVEHNKELAAQINATNPQPMCCPTECAHIFPASLTEHIPPGSAKRMASATLWTFLRQFGYSEVPEQLDGANIHRLENVMTLRMELHYYFDTLNLWFVAMPGKPNQYTVKTSHSNLTPFSDTVVTFGSEHADLPPPSPLYLAIHAACAQVAHLSGAAEHIDKYDRDVEDITVLSPTGESAGLLDHALRGLQIAGY